MAVITIWHNPRCSKSRQALALLEAECEDLQVRRYLEDTPSVDELKEARAALGNPPLLKMMRRGEKAFGAAGLIESTDEEALLRAMNQNPILIERPMVFRAGKGVSARPPGNVRQLL